MNLSDFFEVVLTYTDTKVRKPNKKAFLMILKRLKLKSEEVLMVGDALDKDIIGAKKLGIKTCYAKYGDTGFKTDKRIKPDCTITSVDKLLKVIKK